MLSGPPRLKQPVTLCHITLLAPYFLLSFDWYTVKSANFKCTAEMWDGSSRAHTWYTFMCFGTRVHIPTQHSFGYTRTHPLGTQAHTRTQTYFHSEWSTTEKTQLVYPCIYPNKHSHTFVQLSALSGIQTHTHIFNIDIHRYTHIRIYINIPTHPLLYNIYMETSIYPS